MNSLSQVQKEAVMYNEGPSLVIAGAGSGKTRVLTFKVAYLISLGLKPYNILALTFTNKAANEMRSRIADMVDPDTAKMLNMGTFHSVFAKILRVEAEAAGLSKDYNIIDADDAKKLVKDIVKDMKLDEKAYKPAVVLGRISNAKNELVTAEGYKKSKMSSTDLMYRIPYTADIYAEYEKRKKASNAVDFDDLLMLTALLFAKNPAVLEKYQDRFQFILVDEYQDTNRAQSNIIGMLANKHHRVCVVGDDAQSIYAFRGANIDNILNFTRVYPEAKLFKLEQNYRSTQNIVLAANSLISNNTEQIKKSSFSENCEGEKIRVIETQSDRGEASTLSTSIKRYVSAGGDWNDVAVLYRTNSQSRVIEDSFLQYNIPYVIYGGHSFYQRAEIKDVLAYLKLIVNTADEISLTRIINKPARGIGATTISKLADLAHSLEVPMFDIAGNPLQYNLDVNAGTAKKLMGFVQLIKEYQEKRNSLDAYEFAKEVVFSSGIMEAFDADSKIELEGKKDNVNELLNGIKQFVDDSLEEGNENPDIHEYLNNIVLLTDADNDKSENLSRVRLMTIHAAKGLEFKCVYVVGLEEGLFPCSSALVSSREMEEERRLLYVAVTRAMERCSLSYAQCRFRNGKMEYPTKSRFLNEIDKKYVSESGGASRGSFDFSRQNESFFTKGFSKPSYSKPTQSSSYGRTLKPISRGNQSGLFVDTVNTSSSSVSAGSAMGGKSVSDEKNSFSVGTRIMHEKFGVGTIAGIEGNGLDSRLTIDFSDNGRKVLLLKYAKLTIIK